MHTLESLIKQYASQYLEQVVAWRRHILVIQNYQRRGTRNIFIHSKILGELGIPYVNDVSDYTVIGEIQTHTGPVVALRADIDATANP